MSENLPITEEELTILMRELEGKSVSMIFGPGYVSLRPMAVNDWAFHRIIELRKIS
jgi:hypothetical protein